MCFKRTKIVMWFEANTPNADQHRHLLNAAAEIVETAQARLNELNWGTEVRWTERGVKRPQFRLTYTPTYEIEGSVEEEETYDETNEDVT